MDGELHPKGYGDVRSLPSYRSVLKGPHKTIYQHGQVYLFFSLHISAKANSGLTGRQFEGDVSRSLPDRVTAAVVTYEKK